jgi:hypothetical protein
MGSTAVAPLTILQHGRRLNVRFGPYENGSYGREGTGIAADRHAEMHWQLDKGVKVTLLADVRDTDGAMVGEWRIVFGDGTEATGKFSAERTR